MLSDPVAEVLRLLLEELREQRQTLTRVADKLDFLEERGKQQLELQLDDHDKLETLSSNVQGRLYDAEKILASLVRR